MNNIPVSAYATVFAKRLTAILSSDRYVIINETIQDIHVLRVLFQIKSIRCDEVFKLNNRSLVFFFRPDLELHLSTNTNGRH